MTTLANTTNDEPQGYFHAIPRQLDCLPSCDPGGHTVALGAPNLQEGDYYAKGAVRGLHAYMRAIELSENDLSFETLGRTLDQFVIMGRCLAARDCDDHTRAQICLNLELAKTHVAHLLANEALAARLLLADHKRNRAFHEGFQP